jgi:hypothetical protein
MERSSVLLCSLFSHALVAATDDEGTLLRERGSRYRGLHETTGATVRCRWISTLFTQPYFRSFSSALENLSVSAISPAFSHSLPSKLRQYPIQLTFAFEGN